MKAKDQKLDPAVQSELDNALTIMQEQLKERFPKDHEEKYKGVLQELTKVWSDPTDPKGHQYFQDVYWLMDKIVDIPSEEIEWHDATGAVGFLLDTTHPIYRNVDNTDEQAELVYLKLQGMTSRSFESLEM